MASKARCHGWHHITNCCASGVVTQWLVGMWTSGVETVEPDVAEKTVRVVGTADPEVMLEKLMKWSKASGKSVELASHA